MLGKAERGRRRPGVACTGLLLCLLAGAFRDLPAAEPPAAASGFLERNWTRERGLPDNMVCAVLHGRDGYLWIATGRGLARFDGQRFTVWNNVNTPAMGNDFCTRLAEDSEGNLWIGTRDGLLRKDGESFVRFTTKEGLADSFIASMCASKWGGVWVGSKEGLNRVYGNQVLNYPDVGVSRRQVWNLCEDGAGVLWVRPGGELLRYDPRTGAAERFPCPDGNSFDHFVAIQTDGQPGCWAAVADDSSQTTELYHFTQAGWQPRSSPLALALNLQHDFQPLALFRTRLGWDAAGFPAIPKDIPSFRDGDAAFWLLPQRSSSGIVLCLAEDREDNLWLGRETEGLLQRRPKRIENLTSKDGLVHDNTWTLCEARDGAVWIGTDGGISRFKDGVCENFTQTNGLSRNEVRAMAEDRTGTIWVGTLNGLDSIRHGEVTHHRFPGEWFETKTRALLLLWKTPSALPRLRPRGNWYKSSH